MCEEKAFNSCKNTIHVCVTFISLSPLFYLSLSLSLTLDLVFLFVHRVWVIASKYNYIIPSMIKKNPKNDNPFQIVNVFLCGWRYIQCVSNTSRDTKLLTKRNKKTWEEENILESSIYTAYGWVEANGVICSYLFLLKFKCTINVYQCWVNHRTNWVNCLRASSPGGPPLWRWGQLFYCSKLLEWPEQNSSQCRCEQAFLFLLIQIFWTYSENLFRGLLTSISDAIAFHQKFGAVYLCTSYDRTITITIRGDQC